MLFVGYATWLTELENEYTGHVRGSRLDEFKVLDLFRRLRVQLESMERDVMETVSCKKDTK